MAKKKNTKPVKVSTLRRTGTGKGGGARGGFAGRTTRTGLGRTALTSQGLREATAAFGKGGAGGNVLAAFGAGGQGRGLGKKAQTEPSAEKAPGPGRTPRGQVPEYGNITEVTNPPGRSEQAPGQQKPPGQPATPPSRPPTAPGGGGGAPPPGRGRREPTPPPESPAAPPPSGRRGTPTPPPPRVVNPPSVRPRVAPPSSVGGAADTGGTLRPGPTSAQVAPKATDVSSPASFPPGMPDLITSIGKTSTPTITPARTPTGSAAVSDYVGRSSTTPNQSVGPYPFQTGPLPVLSNVGGRSVDRERREPAGNTQREGGVKTSRTEKPASPAERAAPARPAGNTQREGGVKTSRTEKPASPAEKPKAVKAEKPKAVKATQRSNRYL